MKVKFMAKLDDSQIEEIVDIEEKYIKGSGFAPRNILYIKARDWVHSKIENGYEVIDERFPDGEIPYIDEVARKSLNW